MKYIAILCICFSVYLIPPFHYMIPILIYALMFFEVTFIRMSFIIASIFFIQKNLWYFYVMCILVVSYETIRQIIILLGKPLYERLRIIFTITLAILLLLYDIKSDLCLLACISFYFMFPLFKQNVWVLLLAVPCFYQSDIQVFYIMTYVLIVSLLFGRQALPFLVLYYWVGADLSYYILNLLCMLFYQQKKATIVLLCGSLFILNQSITNALMIMISMYVLCGYQFHYQESSKGISQEYSILMLLSEFYEEHNQEISSLLKALCHVFEVMKESHKKEECTLKELLQEYGYDIDEMKFGREDGSLQMKVHAITRGEINGPFLALISYTMKQEYQMISCIKDENGYLVRLGRKARYHYEWDSISFSKQQECGDAYRVFQVNDDIVVLLCDGMGNGHYAHECAYLALRLFQRLCDYGMEMNESIHCINAMMQSERFTTMDVLRLSTQHNNAQMIKSAACPTLLYRNGEIFELNSNALPIGIVSSLDVDVHSFKIQRDDVFFVLSDGFNIEVVKEWIQTKNLISKKGFEAFCQQFAHYQDDATMIKIRVCENM